ncbi:MAG: hypothetical protein WBV74_01080 [Pseudonocardiaceae bacterium]
MWSIALLGVVLLAAGCTSASQSFPHHHHGAPAVVLRLQVRAIHKLFASGR